MAIQIRPAKWVKKVKSKNSQEVLERLKNLLESSMVTGEPVQILCGFWEDQQNPISYQELRQVVIEGEVGQELLTLWSQDYSTLVENKLSHMWQEAITIGATSQPILDSFSFKLVQNSGITNWIKQHGAEFVTVCTKEQKQAIAALLTKKMRDSYTVDELSRLIRPCIGLTKGQTKANIRYYNNIVATLKKDHPRMKQESIQKKAQEAAAKYAERQHRERAMMIAQTESAFAYNRGADEGVRQAQAQGLLGVVKKRWSTSGDDGVCSICSSLDGVEVDMDKEFDFKGKILFRGHHMLPPAHPRCACAVEYVEVDELKYPFGENKDFPLPIQEELQDYREVKLDDTDIRNDTKKNGIFISSKRVITAKNTIYVSDNVNLSRKTLHKIDTGIEKAVEVLNIKDTNKLPPIVIASITEMNMGTLASYNPYTNILYINEYISDKKVLLNTQKGFAASQDSIATYVHELIHWKDAENYRSKYGAIDKDYIVRLRNKCKKYIEKLEKNGYNILDISNYAYLKMFEEAYDEVYTEYRVLELLGR